jgi:hypothetical protein
MIPQYALIIAYYLQFVNRQCHHTCSLHALWPARSVCGSAVWRLVSLRDTVRSALSRSPLCRAGEFGQARDHDQGAGTHDLERALATLDHFHVPALVCINKADINRAQATELAGFCAARGVAVVGQLPYDDIVTVAMVRGEPVITYQPTGKMSVTLHRLWTTLRHEFGFADEDLVAANPSHGGEC